MLGVVAERLVAKGALSSNPDCETMDALRAQVTVLTEELSTLNAEMINVKAAHATLHQSSVDAHTQYNAKIAEMDVKQVPKASLTTMGWGLRRLASLRRSP